MLEGTLGIPKKGASETDLPKNSYKLGLRILGPLHPVSPGSAKTPRNSQGWSPRIDSLQEPWNAATSLVARGVRAAVMRYGDLVTSGLQLRPSRKHHQAMEDVESLGLLIVLLGITPPFSLVVPTCIPFFCLLITPCLAINYLPLWMIIQPPNRDPHFRCQHHFSSSQNRLFGWFKLFKTHFFAG